MNRAEIEIKLNRDRASLLEAIGALPDNVVGKGVTPSQHNNTVLWSAKDHLVHLAGIEHLFNGIIKRTIEGDPSPIQLPKEPDGKLLPVEQMMPHVHAMNDAWVEKHKDEGFLEIVALSQKIRSETLDLLSSLSDEQLQQKIPNAPWGDGAIGTVIAINADHGRRHQDQVLKALAAEA